MHLYLVNCLLAQKRRGCVCSSLNIDGMHSLVIQGLKDFIDIVLFALFFESDPSHIIFCIQMILTEDDGIFINCMVSIQCSFIATNYNTGSVFAFYMSHR